MAFKFLSRLEAKQRILRLDLARTSAPKGKEGFERAIVVTAEMDRLSYFWNDKDGEWQVHTRPHAPLRPIAVAPHETLIFPWSRRNGVAADGDLAVIAFKREFDEKSAGLFLDVLAWSEADSAWRFLTEDKPLALPLAPNCRGVGIDLWAWLVGNEINIVVQAWMRDAFGNPLRPAIPRLVLAQATVDPGDLTGLEHVDAWRIIDLDGGGFDLDARFEKGQIWVVHRRTAASMSFGFNPSGNGAAVWMLDEAGPNPLNIDESLFVADMPPVVVVSCDPQSSTVKVEAEDIPSVEHPQLQRIDPLILTGDRLRFVDISANRENEQWRLRPRVQQARKVAIWRGVDDWRMENIGPLDQAQWPLNLAELAPSHLTVHVADGRISFATRLFPKPTFLWRFDVTSKGIELTFGREDRRIGGVACDRFLVTPDLPTGSVEWEGVSVLDLGHEQIALDAEGDAQQPIENTQFDGLASGSADRAGGGTLEFFLPTVNTLGGLLIAHQDAGHGLCGYVGMGDGGGRVIFESKIGPLEPTVTDSFKALPVEVVSGPASGGRAWITLQATDFTASQLPGYPVPYSDVLRTLPPPGDPLTFVFVFLPAEILLAHFTPRSISGGLQPLLDVLPVANLLLNPEANVSLDDVGATEFDLDRDTADTIQQSLASFTASVESAPLISDAAQPFGIQFTTAPRRIQAGDSATFRASVLAAGVTASTVRWTFTPPQGTGLFNPFDVQGMQVVIPLPLEGEWGVRLRIDATDGRRSEVNETLEVGQSLWRLIWGAHREIGRTGGLRLGTTTMELLRHRVQFRVGADGTRESVHVEYLPEQSAAFRFEEGIASQQGRTTLRLPIALSSTNGTFDGLVGAAVTLQRADIRLNLERPFTLGVLTSDRRSFDLMQQAFYADLDSTEDAPVTADEADVETIRIFHYEPGHIADMTPSALAAKPVGDSTVSIAENGVDVRVALTPLASGISFLIGLVVGLNLVSLVAGPLLATLMVILGPAIIVAIGIGSLAVLVALAISAGIGWLFIQLAQAAAASLANSIARDTLSSPETLAAIADAMDEAGVMNYAGEGLAEAIAIKAIEQAMADGHAVEPPVHAQADAANPGRNRPPSGRERFRRHFFETVVVGPGVCKVLLRVP